MSVAAKLSLPAPAKLNLFLHIVGRRDDGYHLLQTVFQFLDYGDELDFEIPVDGRIHRIGDVPGLGQADDLSVRAARALRERTGSSQGAIIRLAKRLPSGGGLGGGSSDAATTLLALNRLWGCGLQIDDLASLGLELGADVPVFVRGYAAWGEGVGERLEPVMLPEPWYVVVKPPADVSTAAIFSDPQLTRNCPRITISDFLSGGGGNAAESLVRKLYPEVGTALDWLDGYSKARLTGTGACVFAAFEQRESAERALAERPSGWWGIVARGCNRSPLHQILEA